MATENISQRKEITVAETEVSKGASGPLQHDRTTSTIYVGAQQSFLTVHIRLLRTP